MKSTSRFLWILIFALFFDNANAEKLEKVYLDKKNNAHVVTGKGQDRRITSKGNLSKLMLARDNETVAWLALNTWKAEGDILPGSEELVIYRGGKYSSIRCTPFIRDYWFWKNGSQIVIDCGGRHFAGREILYNAKTLEQIAAFDQSELPLEKRPDWSNGDD